MAEKVFFSVSMSLDGFIAPEAIGDLMERQWMELQQSIFPQRYIVLDRSPGLAARAGHPHPRPRHLVRPGRHTGRRDEERFDADLNLLATNENEVGHVSGLAPPGDIHRVRNIADTTAISIHVYGIDLSRVGSSAGRYYD
jgi:hypothetical protein